VPKLIDIGVEANGVIAIGAVATGVVAIGQLATGVIAVGQLARGFVAIGQGALGIRALGQLSVGVWRGSGMVGVAGFRTKGVLVPLIWGPGPRRGAPVWQTALRALLLGGLCVGWVAAAGIPVVRGLEPTDDPRLPVPTGVTTTVLR
jgi:hypothetical protein